jgi:hypothetical protein
MFASPIENGMYRQAVVCNFAATILEALWIISMLINVKLSVSLFTKDGYKKRVICGGDVTIVRNRFIGNI